MDSSVTPPAPPERPDPPAHNLATAHSRQLPGVVIIGAQRGGTTSLYRYLTDHPDIGPSLRKEVHFFDRYYEKGPEWYLAHFPLRGDWPLVVEASPSYLFAPAVPRRIHTALPGARYIAMLRNPVDRAYSQYQLMVRRGIESLPFAEALAAEQVRLPGPDNPMTLPWRHFSYTKRGLYAEQLQRWLAVVPRERLFVIRSEDFYADPAAILERTLDWLGLPSVIPDSLKPYHLAEYPDLDAATRRRLAGYFAPHNQMLYGLIGRDLEWE